MTHPLLQIQPQHASLRLKESLQLVPLSRFTTVASLAQSDPICLDLSPLNHLTIGYPGTITEIYGSSGSGKTLFALEYTLSSLLRGDDVIYISSDHRFPSNRFFQIIQERGLDASIAERLFIQHILDLDRLMTVLTYQLPLLLKQNKVRLVVFDSIASYFRFVSSNADMYAFIKRLKKLADEFQFGVLVVNHVAADINQVGRVGEESIKPALGKTWSQSIDTRLWIRKVQEGGRVVQVVFSSHMPRSESNIFYIGNQGFIQ